MCVGKLNLSPKDFYELTPHEINIKIKSLNENAIDDYQKLYNLGVLMTIGFHSPKDYPPFNKFLKVERTQKNRMDMNEFIERKNRRLKKL